MSYMLSWKLMTALSVHWPSHCTFEVSPRPLLTSTQWQRSVLFLAQPLFLYFSVHCLLNEQIQCEGRDLVFSFRAYQYRDAREQQDVTDGPRLIHHSKLWSSTAWFFSRSRKSCFYFYLWSCLRQFFVGISLYFICGATVNSFISMIY